MLNVLTKICTRPDQTSIARYASALATLMPLYGINTPLRQAHFLAQIAQESGEFRYVEENLKYSASRLMQVFPKYFRTEVAARNAAYNPERIANIVYASRIGNGPAETGDGYTFRGRGLIQLTGRANYYAFLQYLHTLPVGQLPKSVRSIFAHDAMPGYTAATDPSYELDPTARLAFAMQIEPALDVHSACWFWKHNNLNRLADNGATDGTVASVTRAVNGGTNGLAQRKVYFYRARLALAE